MKKIVYVALAFFAFSVVVRACSCIYISTFCGVVNHIGQLVEQYPADFGGHQLIAKGIVLNHTYHGIQMQLLDVIIGNESRDTINVWGDWNGSSCRLTTSVLEDNDTLVIAVSNRENGDELDSIENANDYAISACGVYYLHCTNGQVQGYITQSQVLESMPYEDFKAMVPNCYTTAIEEVGLATNFVYPNPFSEALFVANNQSVRVFDTFGRVVYAGATTPNVPINLSHLPAGIYYIETTQSNKTAKMQKVLKM